MSRAERRAYKRMTKNQDPYAPPGGARRRPASRARSRRPGRAPSLEFRFVTPRFLIWLIGGATAVGLVAFSVAWPNGMPLAAYIGLAGAAAWSALVIAFRLAQRRAFGQR